MLKRLVDESVNSQIILSEMCDVVRCTDNKNYSWFKTNKININSINSLKPDFDRCIYNYNANTDYIKVALQAARNLSVPNPTPHIHGWGVAQKSSLSV